MNKLLPKIDELKCIANKAEGAIVGLSESKLDHTIPDQVITFQGMIFANVMEIEMEVVLLVI